MHRFRAKSIFVSVLALLTVGVPTQSVLVVDADDPQQFAKIQDAVAAAVPGDTSGASSPSVASYFAFGRSG